MSVAMRSIAMKGKVVGFMLGSVVLFSVATGASANGGVIGFRGQVVNSTCEVRRPSSTQSPEQTQRLQVAAHVMLVVNTQDNACSNDLLPFSTHYSVLQTADPSVDSSSESGVVTLTYQ
jgi:hypothetical protein